MCSRSTEKNHLFCQILELLPSTLSMPLSQTLVVQMPKPTITVTYHEIIIKILDEMGHVLILLDEIGLDEMRLDEMGRNHLFKYTGN